MAKKLTGILLALIVPALLFGGIVGHTPRISPKLDEWFVISWVETGNRTYERLVDANMDGLLDTSVYVRIPNGTKSFDILGDHDSTSTGGIVVADADSALLWGLMIPPGFALGDGDLMHSSLGATTDSLIDSTWADSGSEVGWIHVQVPDSFWYPIYVADTNGVHAAAGATQLYGRKYEDGEVIFFFRTTDSTLVNFRYLARFNSNPWYINTGGL